MKRDDDYLRSLIVEIQDSDRWIVMSDLTHSSDEDDFRRHFHILMLVDAGLVAPFSRATYRLTDAGQTFAAQVRDDGAWSRIKAAANAATGHSVALLADIARAYALDALKRWGVPL